jgi:hypothetical protein
MSRKNTFLIILIVVSLLIGGLTGFYFYSKNKNQTSTILGKETSGRSFGGYNPNSKNTSSNQTDTLIIKNKPITPEKILRLRKISSEPVAGAGFVSVALYASSTKNIEPEDTSVTSAKVSKPAPLKLIGYRETIRFMERATGHIYETSTSTLEKTRISNTTLPKIYEALFVEDGESVILRDLVGSTDTIRTRYGILARATTTDSEKSLVTSDLPTGITQLAVSPQKDKTFSVLNEGVAGYSSKPDGGSKQVLLNTAFREWLVSWPEKRTILVTTKPSGFYPGYAYTINTDTKAFTRVLGGLNGLTTLMSPDSTKVLFTKSTPGSFTTNLLDLKTNEVRELNLRTFTEKCIWSNTDKDIFYCAIPEDVAFNTYPDVWYQGKISFSDSIWKINVKTGENRLISKLQEESNGEVLDIQSIYLNKEDDYLLFTDKNTLHLWGLLLKETPVQQKEIQIEDTASSTGTSSRPSSPNANITL